MRVHISEKNSKLGRIPNVSLPPLQTCVENPPCAKLCYARKAYEVYAKSTAAPAWDENLAYYKADRIGYFGDIGRYIERKKPPYFRWHVGGDIPDTNYLHHMTNLAWEYPETNFLAYSRRPWAWGRRAENFIVLRSYWIDEPISQEAGFKVVPKGVPIYPPDAVCPGSCVDCKECWHLDDGDVRFIHVH